MNSIRNRIQPLAGRFALAALLLAPLGAPHAAETPGLMAARFKDPPMQYRSRPFYWLNGKLDSVALREQILAMRDQCGFGGFSPLPMRSTQPAYLSDAYFDQYRLMLEMAEKLGLKVIFYDDIDYPTGSAGGRLAAQHPDSMLKNLRKVEETITGPKSIERPVPKGRLMAAVAMETRTKHRTDLAGFIKDGNLRWDAPKGDWNAVRLDPLLRARSVGIQTDQLCRRQLRQTADGGGDLWGLPE